MKKNFSVVFLSVFILMTAFGGGSSESSGPATLEVAVTFNGVQIDTFKEIVQAFTDETGINVNIVEYGNDYENTIKTRMASNNLPDVFMTHGWSIARYKDYLLDLRDQPWVSEYLDAALGVIRDSDGAIYALMTSHSASATLVNIEVCEAAGVDPWSLHTWDDFEKACEKIKSAGYVPFGQPAQATLLVSPMGTWVAYEGEEYDDAQAILDGTYDWESYRAVLEDYFAKWIENGWFYDDIQTMSSADISERFAANKSAFYIGNKATFIVGCQLLNPDGEYGFIPLPASTDEGKELVAIGENDAFGIWKDSKHIEEAKEFLNFLARPENSSKLTSATGGMCSLSSAVPYDEGVGTELYQEMLENCSDHNILYDNLFDRKYMPNGMWQIFNNAAAMLFDDYSAAGIDATVSYLKENYQNLYE